MKHISPKTTIGYKDRRPIQINCLLYADNIILMAGSQNKMQRLIGIWITEIEKIIMEINISS